MGKKEGECYGVGIGPGDPELLTVKAVRLIEEADVIYVPKAKSKEESLAREIVKGFVQDNGKFKELEFPMVRGDETLKARYDESAKAILEDLRRGLKVIYLTLGDPLVYSTYIYLIEAIKRLCPEIDIQTVPGISSYSAAASLVNVPLGEKNERVAIVSVSEDLSPLEKILKENHTTILMKVAKKLKGIIDLLEKMNLIETSVFVSHVGLEGEYVERDLRRLSNSDEKMGYLSIIIVKNKRAG